MDDNLAKCFLSFLREYEKRSVAILSQEYNVFHVMNKAMLLEDETNCALLLDWLNPNGHHRQGNLFLKAFLLRLGVEPELANHCDWKVLDHPFFESGSPDIVIRNDVHGFLFLVELKIRAQDHSDQLNKYYNYLMKQTQIDSGRKMLVYLTVDGRDPANFNSTSSNPKHFMKLSLQEDIYDWLESVLPDIRNKGVTAAINNYLSALPRIVDEAQGNKIESEIVRYLSKPEFLPIATFIRKNFDKISGTASGYQPICCGPGNFWGWMTKDGSTNAPVIKSIRESGLYLHESTPDGAHYPIEFFADIKQGIVRVGILCNRELTPDLFETEGMGDLKYWLQQRGLTVPTIPVGNELAWREMGSESELTEKSDCIKSYFVTFMGEFHEMVAALNRLMLEQP